MRVLFLAPRVPLPANTGGKIRTLNLIKQIAKHHQLDLICFSFEQDDHEHVRELEKIGITVKLINAPKISILNKALSILLNPIPYSIAKYDSKEMEEGIATLINENQYDLVHFDHIHMAHYTRCLKNFPSIIDEHNVEYKILKHCSRVEQSPIKKLIYSNQAQKMKRFESALIPQFSACTAVSEDDAAILRELTNTKVPVHVIPNGVDTKFFQRTEDREQTTEKNHQSLVFTGSMDWLPNEDAVLFFCKEILPLIWQSKPEVEFYVVGKNPSVEIRRYGERDKRILVTGLVPDVRPYITQAKIFVVPLRIGGGTRLKILEAMSMQKTVLSTTLGAEGIAYSKNENIVLADGPAQFAQKVISLLGHPEAMDRFGRAARKLVCEKYDWSIVGQKLNKIYDEARHAQQG